VAKQEILPPVRTVPAKPDRVATEQMMIERVRPGGPIRSHLMRWSADRDVPTLKAVAARINAEAEVFEAQTLLAESFVRRQRAVALVEELPETIASDRAKRRAERAEALRQAQHKYELGEIGRLTEITHAQAALVDGQQALRAQIEHGYMTYELAFEKKNNEILDIELDAEERRAILREHKEQRASRSRSGSFLAHDVNDDLIDDALHEKRIQLEHEGLDTSRIDAVIERRRAARSK
jgi:hypothetical protein